MWRLFGNNLNGFGKHPFSLLALLAILLALVDASLFHIFHQFDYRFNDRLLQTIAAQKVPANKIVIIDIDEKSLEQMASTHGRYPWPRSVHAELIEGIERQKPQAILFDIIFADPDRLRPEDDAYLAEVAAQYHNLFFPYVRLQSGAQGEGVTFDEFGESLGFFHSTPKRTGSSAALLLPYLALEVDGRLGAINFVEDSDGVGRRYPLYLTEGDWQLPSIINKVAKYLDYTIPDEDSLMLNWQGAVLSYPRISYSELYEDLLREHTRRDPNEFKDKIVIIGSTATGMHDLRVTPMGSLHPAIEIIATAIDNLREGDYLIEVGPLTPFIITLLSIGGVWLLFMSGSTPLLVGGITLLWTFVLMTVEYLWLSQQVVIPVISTLIFIWFYYALAALYAFRSEQRAREQSIQIFSRFLDPRVVDKLVSNGENALDMKSESRQITVLFSDIRGFTTMSEQHSAEEIVDILNRYFSRQVEVVFKHSGTVDKFIGDAIMAFWGLRLMNDNQAKNSINAALEMVDVLMTFREELDAEARGFDVGIGIHTGDSVVGFIGSENRLDYTAIGDTVNLASRIEGQTKGVARILVSNETRKQCADDFDFIERGIFKVKGRTEEVQLFEPRRKTL